MRVQNSQFSVSGPNGALRRSPVIHSLHRVRERSVTTLPTAFKGTPPVRQGRTALAGLARVLGDVHREALNEPGHSLSRPGSMAAGARMLPRIYGDILKFSFTLKDAKKYSAIATIRGQQVPAG